MLLFRIWLNATSSNYVDDEWLIRLTRTPLCREAKKKKKTGHNIYAMYHNRKTASKKVGQKSYR